MNIQKIPLDQKEQENVRTPGVREDNTMDKSTRLIILGVFILLVIAGIGTGYLLSGNKSATTASGSATQTGVSTDGKTFGSSDTKTFADSAVGTIEKDGISGEGTHKLIREGGPTQTACLVSSVLDLNDFVGKKIKVWGNTMDAKKCPWLMDVGRIELQ